MPNSAWYNRAVIYELYVDKFAGNLTGLIDKLDYFNYLGVNTLWLLPHYPSPMVDGGYDISDYFTVRPDLGTLEDFDRLITTAHQKGLKVIIDLVLNHTSSEHPWFRQARESRDNPKRDWYLWSDNQDRFSQAFVHFADTKGSNWIPNSATGDFYYATFYSQQPDLNWDNPEVFSSLMGVVDFWVGRGVDGFRLDAVARLIKRDNTHCFGLPETHQVLKRVRSYIDSKYSNILLMAETGGWPHEAREFFGSGDECQLVLNFPLAVELLSAIQSRDLSRVQDVWNQSSGIPDTGLWATFVTNHDSVDLFFLKEDWQKQQLSQAGNPGGRFSAVDSASFSARLAEVCQGDPDKIIWAIKQQFSLPAVPIIYYGNEIGQRNADLSAAPADFREFVRGSFNWDEATHQQSDPNSLLNQIRQIIQNRKL